MKPFIVSLAIVASLFWAFEAHAQTPITNQQRNIIPALDSQYYLGTTTGATGLRAWLRVIADSFYDTDASDGCAQWVSNVLTSTGSDCGTGSGGAGGGLGTTTPWTTGNLVRVVNNGSVTSIATSSLGLGVSSFLSPNISQWTNDAGYSAFAWPFTRQADLSQGTSTIMSFLGGFYSSASSTLGNTNASTTVAGSLHVGINTSKQNLLSVTAPSGTQFASSDSVGGLTNITNTNNGGSGLLVYTNGGAIRTNDLVRIKSDNILGDQRSLSISHDGVASAMLVDCNNATRNVGAECFNLTDEVGANRTAFGVSGAPTGLGLLKFTINSGSDSSASALSMQLDDTDVQGFFGDTVAGYTGKLLNLRVDGVEKLTLTTDGAVFNASTTLQNFTGINSTTTNSTTTDLHISSDLSFGGVVGSAWSTFCTAITGGAGLCDGDDATGAGGGTPYPFPLATNATSSTVGFFGGILSTASSTFTGSTTLATTLMTNASSTNLAVTNGFAVSGITSAIPITNSVGEFTEYAGTSCTNQFVRSLSALGVATCATVVAGDVDLADLTATDTTLTFSGAYDGQTARTVGLNLANANTWTGGQIFANSTTTNATTTSLAILNLTQASCDVKALTSGVIYCGTDATSAGGDPNSKWATTTSGAITPNSATYVGIGTSTPRWLLQLASSTAPQLSLTDGGSNQWAFRAINNYLEIGTTSPTSFATSTPSAFRLAADYNGTTTINGLVESLGFTVDSGSASTAYTAGWKGFIEVPYDADIIGWTAIATTTDSTTVGTTTIDVYKDTYANYPPTSADSIFTSTKVGIYGGIKSQSTSTPATQRITAGDIVSFYVDSNTNLKRITVILKVKRR